MKVFELIDNFCGPELTASYTDEEIDGMRGELRRVVTDLVAIRADQRKTEEYFNTTIRRFNGAHLTSEELILSLHRVLEKDKLGFSYIYNSVTSWMQGTFNRPVEAYRIPTRAEIQYAIDFDLEEIEAAIISSENPSKEITRWLSSSKACPIQDLKYKQVVEERLQHLLRNSAPMARQKKKKTIFDFLVNQERANDKIALLCSVCEGKGGLELALAVSAAVHIGILASTPPLHNLKEVMRVTGGHSTYEYYKNKFPRIEDVKDIPDKYLVFYNNCRDTLSVGLTF